MDKIMIPENITYTENEPMNRHISFRLGGRAKLFAEPKSADEIISLIKFARESKMKYAVIGNGSNLLVRDEGYDGLVIHLGESFGEIKLLDENTVFAQAGASLMKVCSFALSNSLTGLEFAYGIPGSAGGAAYMNAGAYGGEMKDVLYKCTHIDDNLCLGELEADALKLSYRHSAYAENGCIITGLFMKLKKGDPDRIKEKMHELYARRREKQPLEFPSAGSTFKRPEGYFAGKLIDDLGLRGFSVGGAKVSEKHAGFVINYDGASCSDVLKLCDEVHKRVMDAYGVSLEREIKILD